MGADTGAVGAVRLQPRTWTLWALTPASTGAVGGCSRERDRLTPAIRYARSAAAAVQVDSLDADTGFDRCCRRCERLQLRTGTL